MGDKCFLRFNVKSENMYLSRIFSSLFYVSLCSVVMLGLSNEIFAKEWLVNTQQVYKNALKQVKPGDKIILANGVWTDFDLVFKAQGTAKQPITLTAQTKGKVILSGQSSLRLAGEYLVVSGLVFKNGFTPSSSVISFRRNKQDLAYHSRVTEVVIDNFNNPDKQESDYWVALYGQHNRFDHNHLVGKRNKGVTVAVRLDSESSRQNHHRIDHNYFGPRPIFGSNGGETLRIGTSHYSLTDSFTIVENNYFDRCNGEVEIISVKSGKNILRNNVFFESRGTLTLRHGNGNIVENNVFFGNGVDHTGGIRVINKDQIIRNNYLEGLTGYRFGSGLTVMNGVPNSTINRYHQVDNALIENNTLINVKHVQLAAGSDNERSAVPIRSTMRNNLIVNQDNQQPFSLFDDIGGITFSGNVANTVVDNKLGTGFAKSNLTLTRADNGLYYPQATVNKGISRSFTVLEKAQTGPSWYPKSGLAVAFDSGKKIEVNASGDALIKAITSASSGDTLILQDGQYDVRKLISIDKTLTITAKNATKAHLTFERSTLFEISDGGNLLIDGLDISGINSPDASGNTLIRTKKWGMLVNYRFIMRNSVVAALDVNHSFHVFDSGHGAFADLIELTNNRFQSISGDVLRLNKETEDLGIYNAEYVVMRDNRFDRVSGALVNLYRGGSDESTFGPHLSMVNNIVDTVGLGKRNKSHASVLLHGVQVTDVSGNSFTNTAAITIEHTVAEPQSRVTDNMFSKTPALSVKELHAGGEHTAFISNNKHH